MTIKDMYRRKFYKKFEIQKLVLKSMINNNYFKFYSKLYFTNLFYNFTKDSSISRYKNSCM